MDEKKVVELNNQEVEERMAIARQITEMRDCVETRLKMAKRNDTIFKAVMIGVAVSWVGFLVVAVNKLEKMSAEE